MKPLFRFSRKHEVIIGTEGRPSKMDDKTREKSHLLHQRVANALRVKKIFADFL